MAQSKPGPLPTAPRGARCPVCSAPSDPAARPFCSVRCADVDLSRWLRGAYAIPSQQDDDEDGDDAQAVPRPGTGENNPGDDEA